MDTDNHPLFDIAGIHINTTKYLNSVIEQFRDSGTVDQECFTHCFGKDSTIDVVSDENCPSRVPNSAGGFITAIAIQTKSHIKMPRKVFSCKVMV